MKNLLQGFDMGINYQIVKQGNIDVEKVSMLIKNENVHILGFDLQEDFTGSVGIRSAPSCKNITLILYLPLEPISEGTLLELTDYHLDDWNVMFVNRHRLSCCLVDFNYKGENE